MRLPPVKNWGEGAIAERNRSSINAACHLNLVRIAWDGEGKDALVRPEPAHPLLPDSPTGIFSKTVGHLWARVRPRPHPNAIHTRVIGVRPDGSCNGFSISPSIVRETFMVLPILVFPSLARFISSSRRFLGIVRNGIVPPQPLPPKTKGRKSFFFGASHKLRRKL